MKEESSTMLCTHCSENETKRWTFDGTGTNIAVDEDGHLIHLHFGEPTTTEEESTGQAAFIYEHIVGELYQRKSSDIFFVIADFSKLDDSASPSIEALRLYTKIIRNEQTAMVLCHDVHTGMRGIIQVLSHTPKVKKKIDIVASFEEACALYTDWTQGDPSMRKTKTEK